MNTTENAFTISTDIDEEDLIDLAAAVDALDHLRIVIGDADAEPAENRDLAVYVRRAVVYLEFLRKTIEDGDILTISTLPITETEIHRRISRVLRSGVERRDWLNPFS